MVLRRTPSRCPRMPPHANIPSASTRRSVERNDIIAAPPSQIPSSPSRAPAARAIGFAHTGSVSDSAEPSTIATPTCVCTPAKRKRDASPLKREHRRELEDPPTRARASGCPQDDDRIPSAVRAGVRMPKKVVLRLSKQPSSRTEIAPRPAVMSVEPVDGALAEESPLSLDSMPALPREGQQQRAPAGDRGLTGSAVLSLDESRVVPSRQVTILKMPSTWRPLERSSSPGSGPAYQAIATVAGSAQPPSSNVHHRPDARPGRPRRESTISPRIVASAAQPACDSISALDPPADALGSLAEHGGVRYPGFVPKSVREAPVVTGTSSSECDGSVPNQTTSAELSDHSPLAAAVGDVNTPRKQGVVNASRGQALDGLVLLDEAEPRRRRGLELGSLMVDFQDLELEKRAVESGIEVDTYLSTRLEGTISTRTEFITACQAELKEERARRVELQEEHDRILQNIARSESEADRLLVAMAMAERGRQSSQAQLAKTKQQLEERRSRLARVQEEQAQLYARFAP